MDDFGTGYSSLSYLKKFPIDVIKIDRSFIKDIPDSQDDMEITSAVIAMAHNLKLKVVAEAWRAPSNWPSSGATAATSARATCSTGRSPATCSIPACCAIPAAPCTDRPRPPRRRGKAVLSVLIRESFAYP